MGKPWDARSIFSFFRARGVACIPNSIKRTAAAAAIALKFVRAKCINGQVKGQKPSMPRNVSNAVPARNNAPSMPSLWLMINPVAGGCSFLNKP